MWALRNSFFFFSFLAEVCSISQALLLLLTLV